MKVLRDYVAPIQQRVFEGYNFHGNALLSFVVKYHEKGQRKLVPHHDHSTFTTNTALNLQGIDYAVRRAGQGRRGTRKGTGTGTRTGKEQ